MTTPTRAPHPRQRLLLIIAGVLLVAVIVIVLIVTLGGSDGPPPGSPDAVTDQLAAALQAHSPAQVAAVTCPGDDGQVSSQTRAALTGNSSAQRAGSAEVNGTVAVARIMLAPSASSSAAPVPATVALQRSKQAGWCVAAFAAALPSH